MCNLVRYVVVEVDYRCRGLDTLVAGRLRSVLEDRLQRAWGDERATLLGLLRSLLLNDQNDHAGALEAVRLIRCTQE